MPGKQVKHWGMYHKLRQKGHSKTSAAKITNAAMGRKRSKPKRKGRRR